jgi:hypothetical protein
MSEVKAYKNSKTGIKGLSFNEHTKLWDCRVSKDKKLHRKLFKQDNKQEALKWLENKRQNLS